MKIQLTDAENQQVQNALESNNVRRWFINRDKMKFEIGDIIVKHTRRWSRDTGTDVWTIENINSDNKMAQRYVYVFEDEYGIGYMKQLRVANGSLGKELFCMTDFDFDYTRFEVDPEYAEHVLLDAEFDIKKIHKQSLAARKIIIKMNRKIGRRPNTIKEFNDVADKMSVGNTFWTTIDYTGRYTREYVLKSKTQITVASLDADQTNWSWKNFKKKHPRSVDDTHTYMFQYFEAQSPHYVMEVRGVSDLNQRIIFTTQKPVQQDKK